MSKKKDFTEKAIVVGVGLKSETFSEIKLSLAELEELVYAAGAEVIGTLAQSLEKFQPATLLGKGKIEEIKNLCEETEASLVVIDHQLSGIQSRNLERDIGARVIDRSQLILDIFAQRAQTYEGQLQVELAQMLDQLPRMVGAWMGSLSRQGGGIGTRGPGETALEMDRRRINNRVKQIRQQLDAVQKHRAQHRRQRKRQQVPSFALIGYTNSGKSTLLNHITHSQVLAKDQVFATLDPTTRKVFLPDTPNAVITDTVGFIRKLPTHLIEAFKSTLEESGESDVLIHVIDLSNDQWKKQKETVDQLIEELKWQDKPVIHAFNKVDLVSLQRQVEVDIPNRLFLSAKTGQGIAHLKKMMSESLTEFQKEVELFFPKNKEHLIYELGREATLNKTEAASQGSVCYVKLTPSQLQKWGEYIVS